MITEAMHGAIVADAMRIPWTAVRFSPLFREDKWYDFAESMQLDLEIHTLPFISQRPTPILKMIEMGSKKIVSRALGIKPKWQELIVTGYDKQSTSTSALVEALREVVSLNKTYMSRDDVVESIRSRQYELVQQLKKEYKAG